MPELCGEVWLYIMSWKHGFPFIFSSAVKAPKRHIYKIIMILLRKHKKYSKKERRKEKKHNSLSPIDFVFCLIALLDGLRGERPDLLQSLQWREEVRRCIVLVQHFRLSQLYWCQSRVQKIVRVSVTGPQYCIGLSPTTTVLYWVPVPGPVLYGFKSSIHTVELVQVSEPQYCIGSSSRSTQLFVCNSEKHSTVLAQVLQPQYCTYVSPRTTAAMLSIIILDPGQYRASIAHGSVP